MWRSWSKEEPETVGEIYRSYGAEGEPKVPHHFLFHQSGNRRQEDGQLEQDDRHAEGLGVQQRHISLALDRKSVV